MSTDIQLPKESRSQEIGHKADQALNAQRPTLWRLHSLGGTDDAGLDYQVQLVINERYREIFRLQLKGTESPKKNSTDQYFSVGVKVSTVNYYRQITEPVLIVLCDLSVNPTNPATCPLYFVWARDELDRLEKECKDLNENESCAIRVPAANVLTSLTDISPVLEAHRRLHNTALALDHAVAETLPESGPDQRGEILSNLSKQIPRRGRGFVESISTDAKAPWPEASPDSVAGRLNEIHNKLRIGRTEEATRLLHEVEPCLHSASALEKGEFSYLTGRTHSQRGDDKGASLSFAHARSQDHSVAKYLVAWGESELRLRYDIHDQSNLIEIVDELRGSQDAQVVALTARMLAAMGQSAEAEKMLNALPRQEALNTLAIIASMRDERAKVLSFCAEGLNLPRISDASKQLFHLLKARAHFNQALNLGPSGEPHQILPTTGPANVDFGELHLAWVDIRSAVDFMKEAGWPPNIELFVDVWTSTAVMLGLNNEMLLDIAEAARKRPEFVGLQEGLERVAVQCGRFDLVVEALNRQPDTADVVLRKVAAFHQDNKHNECLRLLLDRLPTLPRDHELFPVCLSLGILAADQLVRDGDANTLEQELNSKSEWRDHALVLQYFRTVGRNRLARDSATADLLEAYKSGASSRVVAAT